MPISMMLCMICEEKEPTHICSTCVNPSEEENIYGGVVICSDCKITFHSKGFFLKHKIQLLQVEHKKKMLHTSVKGFLTGALERIKSESTKSDEWKSKISERVKQAHSAIHDDLVGIYDLFIKQLDLKETQLSSEVNKFAQDNIAKLDGQQVQLNELAAQLSDDFEPILTDLLSTSEELDEQSIFQKLESSEKRLAEILNQSLRNVVGPYVEVNQGSIIHETTSFDVSALSLSSLAFHTTDSIWNKPMLMSDADLIEGFEFEIPKHYLGKNILNSRNLRLTLPHPYVVKNGRFVMGVIESYIIENVTDGKLKLLTEQEMQDSKREMVVARCKRNAKYFRCSYSSLVNEDSSKQYRKRGSSKDEAVITLLDEDQEMMRNMSVKSIDFYEADENLLKIPPLCLQVSFTKTVKPSDVHFENKAKLKKLLENGQSMNVILGEKVSKESTAVWMAQVSIDGTNFYDVLDHGDKPENSKLCQDVRLLNKSDLPVVREIVVGWEETGEDLPAEDDSPKSSLKNEEKNEYVENDATSKVKDADSGSNEAGQHLIPVVSTLTPNEMDPQSFMENLQVTITHEQSAARNVSNGQGSINSVVAGVLGLDAETKLSLSPLAQEYIRQSCPANPPPNDTRPATIPQTLRQVGSDFPQQSGEPTPSGWDVSSRSNLKYLTLILFGEYSAEFTNIDNMTEPPPPVREAWMQSIRIQQLMWEVVPVELFQHIMHYEIQRFPDLYPEFFRFRVPLNITCLPARLGEHMADYLEKFPQLQGILNFVAANSKSEVANQSQEQAIQVVLDQFRNLSAAKLQGEGDADTSSAAAVDNNSNMDGNCTNKESPVSGLNTSSSTDHSQQSSQTDPTPTLTLADTAPASPRCRSADARRRNLQPTDQDRYSNNSSSIERDDNRHDNRVNRRGGTRGPAPITCYNCKETGHYAANCTYPSTSKSGSDRRNKRYDDSSHRRGKRQWRDPVRK